MIQTDFQFFLQVFMTAAVIIAIAIGLMWRFGVLQTLVVVGALLMAYSLWRWILPAIIAWIVERWG